MSSLKPQTVQPEAPASISPPVHLEFIQNQAGLAAGSVEEVEAYHRALFLHHHAAELERYEQQTRVHENRLEHLETRLKDTTAKLTHVDSLIPVEQNGGADVKPNSPWNAWDATMFVASALGILALLVFGVLNISFNLLESGLVTFVESPIRSYFWAALLPVGALGVKVGWDFLQHPRLRDLYVWTCLVLGVAGVLVWIGAYASVYPTLSRSVTEQIQSLSVFDNGAAGAAITPAGAKWVDALTVGAQAVAEVFLSAVLGMYMTTVYGRHRPVRLAGNPLFTEVNQERLRLEDEVARERLALAEARGNRTRIENQLAALLAFARNMFHKEAARQRDDSEQRKNVLEELSRHLRAQLDTLATPSLSRPALNRQNGGTE